MQKRSIAYWIAAMAVGLAASTVNAENPGRPLPACANDAHHVVADNFADEAIINLPAGERMVSYRFSQPERKGASERRLCVETATMTKNETAVYHKESAALSDGSRIRFTIVEHDLTKHVFRSPSSP